eukprot:Phypoly_transcript_02740.p1 GENE.Phypoly_transcript_02740~~Phypoly_transcript_02740.p1  ORF type:complete len:802 (+),score=91.40 Phypoly_transcript_02740:51-2456(+)
MSKRPSSEEDTGNKKAKLETVVVGSHGKALHLITNFYQVGLNGNPDVFQHELNFEPFVESRPLRSGLLRNIVDDIGDFIPAGEMLFLKRKVNLVRDTESKARPGKDPIKCRISIRFVKKIDGNEFFYAINMLFKKLMGGSGLEPINGAYFDPRYAEEVVGRKGSFFVWPGYKTTLTRTCSGLLLNAELKSKVVRKETVLYFITQPKPKSQQEAQALLEGRSVIAGYNNKAYRITKIDYDMSPNKTTFVNKKTGQPITVLAYMQERYPEIKGIDGNQPLIVYIPKRGATGYVGEPIYLIPQLCVLTGLSDEWRTDFAMMTSFKDKTLIKPQERFAKFNTLITGFVDPKLIEKAKLHSWQVAVNPQPLELRGRRLDPEALVMKDNAKKDALLHNANGEWTPHQQNLKFHFVPGDSPKVHWAVIYPKDMSLGEFAQTFNMVASGAGLELEPPAVCELDKMNTDGAGYYNALVALKKPIQFVLCVLPSRAEDRYNKIKSVYCTATPVVSQCILQQTLRPKNMHSVSTKLVFQIVAKLGGAPWILKDSGLSDFKRVMIIGIDVSHNKGKPSTVGMVASMNNTISKFYSQVYQNSPGNQNVTQLGLFIKNSFQEYKKRNGTFPMSILVYRDGLGESQIKAGVDAEYQQIIASLKEGKVPVHEVIYVVVQKKIDVRFAMPQGNTLVNAPSGTVVDTGVVASAERHQEKGTLCDFYLIGQSHKQGKKDADGTMNPAHYWVRHSNPNDKESMSIDQIQSLTYKLCHLYYNWTGTISAPALCKYAKVLATRAGQSFTGNLNSYHHDKLGYI